MDEYYTPKNMALRLTKVARKRKVRVVADFCAGEGELLKAALKKWPSASAVATDLSTQCIRKLNMIGPGLSASKCDFLNLRSRGQSIALRNCSGPIQADLILMNPPFTCPGGTTYTIETNGRMFKCGTALAFIGTALNYLSSQGELVAILPEGCERTERDREMWNYLVDEYDLNVVERISRNTFAGCSPRSIIVRLSAYSEGGNNETLGVSPNIDEVFHLKNVFIIRGKRPVHSLEKTHKGGFPVIHSTNLQKGVVGKPTYRVSYDNRLVHGPIVLLPRVGEPREDKICVYTLKRRIALTDCVLALQTDTVDEATSLRNWILKDWSRFEMMYRGTGARYITLKEIKSFLLSKGIESKIRDWH